MLHVRSGDSGPRVVLLQVLLNRAGAQLVVDGVFGPRTREIVTVYQGHTSLTPSGAADPATWRRLLGQAALNLVEGWDVGDPHMEFGAAVAEQAGALVIRTGAASDGVRAVVTQIRECVRPGAIGLLKLWGHGNLGRWLSFAVGEVVHTSLNDPAEGARIASARRSYIGQDNFDEVAGELTPLRPLFAPFGSYEHHGCRLASVEGTRRNVQRIADLLGVPVTIPYNLQGIPMPGYEMADFRYQGPTFTPYPGAVSMRTWARAAAGTSPWFGPHSGMATPFTSAHPRGGGSAPPVGASR